MLFIFYLSKHSIPNDWAKDSESKQQRRVSIPGRLEALILSKFLLRKVATFSGSATLPNIRGVLMIR